MTASHATRRFNWPTQLFVNCVTKTTIAKTAKTTTNTLFYRTKRNPSICFVRNVLAGVLCVMSADVPTASRLYVAIAESGCAPIVGTAMICAGAMVIVRVAALRSIAVPMDGLVASVTSGCVLGAVGATIHARNAALERNPMTTMSNLSPSIYIMAAFASPEKILTGYFHVGEPYDTYQIPAGTRLFKSYRDTLAKWSPDKVFPLTGPAYFGFDEPNVSENYGFAFAYKTTQPYELLAIDSQKTLKYLWGLAEDREDVRRTLTTCFGYHPDEPEKPQIRESNEGLDYVLVRFLCNHGFEGYAGDYIATAGGGRFHPECVMCGETINVEINTEYNVNGKPGLASPIGKHPGILSMLTSKKLNINPQKRKNDRHIEDSDDENEDPNTKRPTISKNLFSDFDGGSRHKKRTQKKRVSRRNKMTQIRHNKKKNKSRK